MAISGPFYVRRAWNIHGDSDHLVAWDVIWGPVWGSQHRALQFPTFIAALDALDTAEAIMAPRAWITGLLAHGCQFSVHNNPPPPIRHFGHARLLLPAGSICRSTFGVRAELPYSEIWVAPDSARWEIRNASTIEGLPDWRVARLPEKTVPA